MSSHLRVGLIDFDGSVLLDACANAVHRLQTAIHPTPLAYLLATGTIEGTIRDLLACELSARGLLVAREWEDWKTGRRMKIDMAIFDPAISAEMPAAIVELKWQNSKDCRRASKRYPYLVNVQKDFDKRTSLRVSVYALVLYTHISGRPNDDAKQVVRFWREHAGAWIAEKSERLDAFRAQLQEQFAHCHVFPGPGDSLRVIEAGNVFGMQVGLGLWVVRLDWSDAKPAK